MSLLDTLLAKGAKPMERVGCLSKKEFLERFGLCNKPCVIERLSESWPALAKWSWKQLGEMNEEALVTDDGDRFESVRVGDFVSKIRDKSAGKLYMKDATFHHGAMSQDFATPDMFENWLCEKELTNKHPRLCDPHYPRWSWMYVGPKNSSSPLHVDVFHSSAFNCVMRGRKMWMFFPPEVLEKDLVKPDGSYWDPFDPVSPIPFEKALVTLQNEGDIVFTPSRWFHGVLNVEDSIALTENFVNETNYLFVLQYLQKTLEEEKGKEMEAATRLVFENLQSVVAAKFAK